MLLYRRRILLYSLMLLCITSLTMINVFHLFDTHCKDKIEISIPDNFTDKTNIIKLNTRILCWIPTTLKRLDRAIVVYE